MKLGTANVFSNGTHVGGHLSREQQMFQGIVYRALLDTEYAGVSREHRLAKRQADSWIRGRGVDFREVCDCAGMDPDFVRDRYIRGDIDFAALRRATPEAGE